MQKLMSPDLPKGIQAPKPGDGSSSQLLGEAGVTAPPDGEVVEMLGHAAFTDQAGPDTEARIDPAEVEAKLSDASLSRNERYQLRIDAATEAATDGDIDRMYELLDPRRDRRFMKTRTIDAISQPGPRAIVLSAAVKAGHGELYEEMVNSARRAVGTRDNQVDAYLAAAEVGWSEGITRTERFLDEPVKVTGRGRSPHVSNAKAREAEARIAAITAAQTAKG
jgi:hypothetical protein